MADLLLTVLNMSITAGFAALIIIFIRGSLGRLLPRTFSHALWLIVLYRMVFPYSFSSIFSVLGNLKANLDRYTAALMEIPQNNALNYDALSGHSPQELAWI